MLLVTERNGMGRVIQGKSIPCLGIPPCYQLAVIKFRSAASTRKNPQITPHNQHAQVGEVDVDHHARAFATIFRQL
jgi:hypothetical protein